jgi:hypothetical protein
MTKKQNLITNSIAKRIFILIIFNFIYLFIFFKIISANSNITDSQKIIEINKPSVVLIVMNIKGQIQYRQPIFNQTKAQQILIKYLEQAYYQGKININNKDEVVTFSLKLMAEKPELFVDFSNRTKTQKSM